MTTIVSFINRLNKIGIKVELIGNYPWVYMRKINGKVVKGVFQAEHGFTIFFKSIKTNQNDKITDISLVFKKIRETLNQN